MGRKGKKRKGIAVLNVGCGPKSCWIPETEGLDIVDYGQKWVGDILEFEPPYLYDLVYAHHFVEHIQDQIALFEKFGEILKKGGALDIRVPTTPFEQAFADPTHVKFIPSSRYFGHFTKDSKAGYCYTKHEFELVREERDRFRWELHVVMRKVK